MASNSGKVVTRFAPSPTGFLHIGGARTALFNWLFARHHGGKALLRIEDTDRKRSTQEAIDAILDGLDWLGLEYDEAPTFQSERAQRHAQVAQLLLDNDQAYRCYATPQELEEMRAQQRANKLPMRYDGRWRDRTADEAPDDTPFVVRLKSPQHGEIVIEDMVQGCVRVKAGELDDYVLLRADGTPTYMLAAVVDDHDMGCTHIIRGDDHLNNAFRQLPIYRAMDAIEGEWPDPQYAHIPLIHGNDGAKLSKRHGSLGVESYRDEMGILPEALFNYLLRLGWAHGDREEMTRKEAIALFDETGIGKSPSRFDSKKLLHLNGQYMREADDQVLAELVAKRLVALNDKASEGANEGASDGNAQESANESSGACDSENVDLATLVQAMPALKSRAKDLNELAQSSTFLFAKRPLPLTEKAAKLLDEEGRSKLKQISIRLGAEKNWTIEALEATTKELAEELELGLGKLAQPMRAALTGTTQSPGIFDVLVLLGRDEALARIDAQANTQNGA